MPRPKRENRSIKTGEKTRNPYQMGIEETRKEEKTLEKCLEGETSASGQRKASARIVWGRESRRPFGICRPAFEHAKT